MMTATLMQINSTTNPLHPSPSFMKKQQHMHMNKR